jgi:hypothetical protein
MKHNKIEGYILDCIFKTESNIINNKDHLTQFNILQVHC